MTAGVLEQDSGSLPAILKLFCLILTSYSTAEGENTLHSPVLSGKFFSLGMSRPHIYSIPIRNWAELTLYVPIPDPVWVKGDTYYMKWKNLITTHPLTHSFCSSLMGNLR